MSTGVHTRPARRNRPWRRGLSFLVALIGVVVIGAALYRTVVPGPTRYSWPPRRCVVHGVDARCGTFVVPENRAKPEDRTVGLDVVVLPASVARARKSAVAYLTGGPGDAAIEQWFAQGWQTSALNMFGDVLLVDQRGTGRSRLSDPDVTQYGTRMAMADLDAVRAALGYRKLDLFGSSYGATAAQVYAKLYPSRVRSLILMGATAIDVPIFDRWAVNAQRALGDLASLCTSDASCGKAFPAWKRQFSELVRAWNERPGPMTGDELASVVHVMLLDVEKAVSVPLLVSRAAKGDYGPLNHPGSGDLHPGDLNVMGSSIWCNEPWVGLDAHGPWGTDFDGYATSFIAGFRRACKSVPRRLESPSLWTLPIASRVPLLALVGGADPQDPVTNLPNLKQHFPDSRTVILPHTGHRFYLNSCYDRMMADFVARGTTKGLDTTPCDSTVVIPPFTLSEG